MHVSVAREAIAEASAELRKRAFLHWCAECRVFAPCYVSASLNANRTHNAASLARFMARRVRLSLRNLGILFVAVYAERIVSNRATFLVKKCWSERAYSYGSFAVFGENSREKSFIFFSRSSPFSSFFSFPFFLSFFRPLRSPFAVTRCAAVCAARRR